MLRRTLCLTPRLARQHLARNCYAIVPPHAYHVQWRRAGSSKTSTDSTKAPRSYKRYSAEEDSTILQMRALNHDWNSIASALPGRSMTSVRKRFYTTLNIANVGQKYKKATTEEVATMRDMLARGFYITAIAQKVGRSYPSTYDYCRHYRAEQQPSQPTIDSKGTKRAITYKKWTRAEIDRLLSLHAAGLKPSAVARELGRSLEAVRAKCRCHIPHRLQPSQFIAEGSGGDSVATLRPRARKTWSKKDEERLAELVANGMDFERIASVFDRTVIAVTKKWTQFVRPRLDYERKIGNLNDASGEQKQGRQTGNDLSQLDLQSRRNFTTLHGWEPRLATNPQKQSSTLTYNSRRVAVAAPWKCRGVSSLPYHPQQRFAHTESTQPYQTKRKQSRRPFSEEESCKIVELYATQFTWPKIGEIMGRPTPSVYSHWRRSLQQQRWREKFEQVRAAVPDDQKHYTTRNDLYSRGGRRVRWSAEEYEKIVDLRAKGYSWDDTAEAMGRSCEVVRKKGVSLLKEERWMRRFEAVASAVPEAERYSLHNGRPRITREEDAVISNMRKAGKSFKLIAEAIGRSQSAVTGRWKRHLDENEPLVRVQRAAKPQRRFGLCCRRFTAEEDSQLRHMDSSGKTPTEMAIALGTLVNAVWNRLKILRAPTRKPTPEHWTVAETQRLRSAVTNAKQAGEVQRLFPNRTEYSLRNKIRRLKMSAASLFTDRFERQKWTPAQDAELLRLRGAGQAFKTVSASMGKSVKSCSARYDRIRKLAS